MPVMPRPLLPAIDAAGQVREVGFALLLRHRRPVEVTELAEATGLGADTAGEAVTKLAGAGWLDLDDSGRVSGAAGLPRRPPDLCLVLAMEDRP
jgi:predicted transcriptional regulator